MEFGLTSVVVQPSPHCLGAFIEPLCPHNVEGDEAKVEVIGRAEARLPVAEASSSPPHCLEFVLALFWPVVCGFSEGASL